MTASVTGLTKKTGMAQQKGEPKSIIQMSVTVCAVEVLLKSELINVPIVETSRVDAITRMSMNGKAIQ
jgi:hypothetical protein